LKIGAVPEERIAIASMPLDMIDHCGGDNEALRCAHAAERLRPQLSEPITTPSITVNRHPSPRLDRRQHSATASLILVRCIVRAQLVDDLNGTCERTDTSLQAIDLALGLDELAFVLVGLGRAVGSVPRPIASPV
jgi:hypothetical protein